MSPTVLQFDLDSAAPVLSAGSKWLSQAEVSALARLGTRVLRERAMASRVILRAVLGSQLGASPEDVAVQSGRYGKPVLDGPLEFNVSHSGATLLIALHPDSPVGVDVELRSRALPLAPLWSCLSRHELEVPPMEQSDWLCLWVRKEATVKATGQGLAADLTGFTVGHRHPIPGHWSAPSGIGEPVWLTSGTLRAGDPFAVTVLSDEAPSTPVRLLELSARGVVKHMLDPARNQFVDR